MAAVSNIDLIPETYASTIMQKGPAGMVYLPIDISTFNKCWTSVSSVHGSVLEGFERPPFFQDRTHSKAIGAHVSVISVAEAKECKIQLSSEKSREVTLNFSRPDSSGIVEPKNWIGISKMVVLKVECPDFAQLREEYGLPPNQFPFSLTLAVKRNIPQQISKTVPVIKQCIYSKSLQKIMENTYIGTGAVQRTSGLVYMKIEDSLYHVWRMIPETINYSMPIFWSPSGVGLHATAVSAGEAKLGRVIDMGDWIGKSMKFTVTGFTEVDPPRSWQNVRKAIQLIIKCSAITEFRKLNHLPAWMPPHVTIGVNFDAGISRRILENPCHSTGDFLQTVIYPSSRHNDFSYSSDDDF